MGEYRIFDPKYTRGMLPDVAKFASWDLRNVAQWIPVTSDDGITGVFHCLFPGLHRLGTSNRNLFDVVKPVLLVYDESSPPLPSRPSSPQNRQELERRCPPTLSTASSSSRASPERQVNETQLDVHHHHHRRRKTRSVSRSGRNPKPDRDARISTNFLTRKSHVTRHETKHVSDSVYTSASNRPLRSPKKSPSRQSSGLSETSKTDRSSARHKANTKRGTKSPPPTPYPPTSRTQTGPATDRAGDEPESQRQRITRQESVSEDCSEDRTPRATPDDVRGREETRRGSVSSSDSIRSPSEESTVSYGHPRMSKWDWQPETRTDECSTLQHSQSWPCDGTVGGGPSGASRRI